MAVKTASRLPTRKWIFLTRRSQEENQTEKEMIARLATGENANRDPDAALENNFRNVEATEEGLSVN